MVSPAISARLKYLNDSAHLLATSAPRTSAHLMSKCHKLMFDNDLDQSDAHKTHVCGACGNIMILGWTSTRQLKAPKAQKGKRKGKSSIGGKKIKIMAYTCELCGRQTRQNINMAFPRTSGTLKAISHTKSSQTATPLKTILSDTHPAARTPSSASANASSRKRAKARKQGGLQALLAKSKETSARGPADSFGLGLLDLMRKA